jgi:DNA processing protein
MDIATLRLCLKLHSLEYFNDAQIALLLRHYGSPVALWQSDPASWPLCGLGPQALQEFDQIHLPHAAPRFDVESQLQALLQSSARIIAICDEDYPALLGNIYDPPPFLYLRGNSDVLQRPTLAVVGSRRASSVALRATEQFCRQAVHSGLQVCSGLALGIDGAAHRGAVEAGGASIGVMATGIEQIYPRRHQKLAQSLLQQGCLLTEFPPGMAPLRHNFPRRNRIISGLSLGVLVMEAALPSGSLITATTAMEQGREVFALPWSPFHAGGAGCLHLLRDGAKMVLSLQDVVEELGPLAGVQQQLFETGPEQRSDTADSALLRLIGCEAISVDQLVSDSQLPVPTVLAELSSLEVSGRIVQCAGGYMLC